MGSGNSKVSTKLYEHLSAEEQNQLQSYFGSMFSGKKEKFKEELTKVWQDVAEEYLLKVILHYFFGRGDELDFETFIRLFTHLNRGSVDEKIAVLIRLLDTNEDQIFVDSILKYVQHLISAFVKTYQKLNTKDYQSWNKDVGIPEEDLKELVKYVCIDLPGNVRVVTAEQLAPWVSSWSLLLHLQTTVFMHLYQLLDNDNAEKYNLIPHCIGVKCGIPFPSILSWPNIIFLNSSLPVKLRDEWRFLFSTKVHGESFSKIIDRVIDQGPTILIVRDADGYVFGGFAPHSWKLCPHFVGDETSFLFCLKPTVVRFDTTGYNNHFQYLNVQQQTLPNGLGMGGQFSYFGLWLDAEFGTGHCSETCTTYKEYKMLSAKKNFEVDHVELWGLGPKPVSEESHQKSILDVDLEARAVLEMAGKTRHSEGYREPEEE